jgi:hypothetical protein
MVGHFDSVNNIPINSVAWWDGNEWNPFDTTRFIEGITRAIEYQGELYAGGNFSNYNGSLKRLARWNGAEWLPVGNGITGGIASIGSFKIYNGDLYIGGHSEWPMVTHRTVWRGGTGHNGWMLQADYTVHLVGRLFGIWRYLMVTYMQ